MKDLIVIPARFASMRLPGKPLIDIGGHTLLSRVVSVAMQARKALSDIEVVVATDDERIEAHAHELGISCVLTDSEINSGSDRALAAARTFDFEPRFILNLQGDAPFVSLAQICDILSMARTNDFHVTTPVMQLSWEALDTLRTRKMATPFSGTTCVRGKDGRAYWFSKTVLPAIRNEEEMRADCSLSPVFLHIGLYCYRYDTLDLFQNNPESYYEHLEGLEQLRIIEMGVPIHTVVVSPARITMSGIDNPEDVLRAESLIEVHGDPFVSWSTP